ncbi:DUF3422 family protein [Pseudomonas sp. N040]|uniref:DUF3422 family protein n=1 Tax=Pseudomonas sp. N040 TaxID=2785325 RepID=UPI0018A3246A|nr:DUF3422 domain-containing protein [Pseudomonas sp. N040]MBF7728569.1 DUF3422 domain-containing protein [Pseudomonas sp. N040]MBW7012209.1 DUF3422 domain-containing protein [Pseudomonas sp. N040]
MHNANPQASGARVCLHFHPEREALFNELHARPFPVLATPAHLSQLVLLPSQQQPEAEYQHLLELCQRHAVLPPSPQSSCYYQDFGGFELRWERHAEFSTYTMISQRQGEEAFSRTALMLLPEPWLRQLPGQLLGATHIEISHAPADPPSPNDMRAHFEGHRLISSLVNGDKARLWSAYRIHSDGAGRMLIHNQGLNPCQTGRLVRTLLEMEAYRMMLLLALPPAKAMAPQLQTMDQQLAGAIQQINQIRGLHDERHLLGELSALAARIEQLSADNNFRFSAARAYHELIINRLDELREQEYPGLQTFSEFLKRRLTPAWRTCEAADLGLDDLSRRIDRASELLRTRIDLTIETQNQQLMQTMNRRSHAQWRLQQTVEGLSVAAISYYLVGLSKYLAESAKAIGLISSSILATGLAVPLCVGLVWLGMHRLKRRLRARDLAPESV